MPLVSEIVNKHEFYEILINTNSNELDITYSLINEQHDVLEELLGVSSVPADDATGMMKTAPGDAKCGNTRVGLDSCHFATPWHLFKTQCLLH